MLQSVLSSIHSLFASKKFYSTKLNRFLKVKAPGFTLIELAIVMIIVGIITAGVFKGKDLIEEARLQSTLSEFNRIKMLLIQYREQFGQWPGNDSRANQYFQGAQNGNGRGLIQDRESAQVWVHLEQAGLCESNTAPPCKIGGYFSIQATPKPEHPGNWIILSARPGTLEPVLTPKQALFIKSKWGEATPNQGQLRVIDGDGNHTCLSGNTYDTSHSNPACVVMMKF